MRDRARCLAGLPCMHACPSIHMYALSLVPSLPLCTVFSEFSISFAMSCSLIMLCQLAWEWYDPLTCALLSVYPFYVLLNRGRHWGEFITELYSDSFKAALSSTRRTLCMSSGLPLARRGDIGMHFVSTGGFQIFRDAGIALSVRCLFA